jgi:hypothetical protein
MVLTAYLVLTSERPGFVVSVVPRLVTEIQEGDAALI